MLERSDYYINIPPQDISISGDIMPISDIAGKDHPLRAEDIFYLFEFMMRIGAFDSSSLSSLPNRNLDDLFSETRVNIADIDAYIASKSRFREMGLIALLDGNLTGLSAWIDEDDFVDWLCSQYTNTAVSGVDTSLHTKKPFDGDTIRRMYWWLNIKSKCWRVLNNDPYAAALNNKLFISYVSGLNNLPFIRWTSGPNINPTPITETVIADARIDTDSWETRSTGLSVNIQGLDLSIQGDYSQTNTRYYVKKGGLLDDVEAVFRINRTDITDFVAFIQYRTSLNATVYYKTIAVPFVKVSDTDWKVKIWDNAVAISLLSYAGYDTSVIDGSAVSDTAYPTPSVYSRLATYAYKVNDKASLPAEWDWSPS